MLIFTIILMAWALVGFIGILNCKRSGIMWEMIIFAGAVPLIPFLAKFFGIF